MKQKIYLLGGHDLEMLEIKRLLSNRPGILVFDNDLTWDNAELNAYRDQIDIYKNQDGVEIIGIELRTDDKSIIPTNYQRIDHHNNLHHNSSALEQVADLLHVQLSREQQLIAANDRGYIPAMLKLGASQEEIEKIRFRDKQAQGVTAADEQQAHEDIIKKTVERDILVIHTALRLFSPICDQLFPFEKLLIYSDQSLDYYGKGKNLLVDHYQESIQNGKMYHGGGDDGYIGTSRNAFNQNEIETIKDCIIQLINRNHE